MDYVSKVTDDAGKEYFWTPAMGTSMATPYVAGSLALWLEADPTLTMDTVKEIIAATATRDEDVISGNPVQWGAGKFNAYAGLAEVIRRSSVADVATDITDRLIVTRDGSTITATLPAAAAVNARLVSTSGATVLSTASTGDSVTLDVSSVPSGIYLLNVNGGHTLKIAL